MVTAPKTDPTTHIKSIIDLDYYIGVPSEDGNQFEWEIATVMAPTVTPSTTCLT